MVALPAPQAPKHCRRSGDNRNDTVVGWSMWQQFNRAEESGTENERPSETMRDNTRDFKRRPTVVVAQPRTADAHPTRARPRTHTPTHLAAGYELLLEPGSGQPQRNVFPQLRRGVVQLGARPAVHVALHVRVGKHHLGCEYSGGGGGHSRGSTP